MLNDPVIRLVERDEFPKSTRLVRDRVASNRTIVENVLEALAKSPIELDRVPRSASSLRRRRTSPRRSVRRSSSQCQPAREREVAE